MPDLLPDLGELSRSFLLRLLRGLWWLGWDFCVRTVGWSIGWIVLRALSLGRIPDAGINQLDDTPWLHGLLIETLGLGLLAISIYALSST